MHQYLKAISLAACISLSAQQIENPAGLSGFAQKLKANNKVTNILFLGDSHIQAGWIPEVLREKFTEKYGYAGRGLVFPYAVANSNGPLDITSVSNQAWQTFRLVYDQDVFSQMGALGFVMGNNKDSFIEIGFNNPNDAFDEVRILNDKQMAGESFTIYETNAPLNSYIAKRKNIVSYTVQQGETFPELAAKFNTTTTRLAQLNGNGIKFPQPGQVIKAEQTEPDFNPDFEQKLTIAGQGKYAEGETVFNYPKTTRNFLMRTNAAKGNILYGFQFLKKNASSGIVFNSVGVNGATYADFLKYPLQLEELKQVNPDVVMISLGTNESLSTVTKEEFQKSAQDLIQAFRKDNPTLPILLISPTDNKLKGDRIQEIVSWIKEISTQNNTAFLSMYDATGGKGYFVRSLARKEANGDGVHFLKPGYTQQAEMIWKALNDALK
ncbi:peptidoglycan-binding protein [Elizabethkingia sp. HvH-WGS333]|uniref:GDSL-type esterase/lipase family protein n=1 Tax=Elizabethkingia TaxID=308865 RepID=UPI0007415CCE|nr:MULTISPECIES: GDSL-type esterase/lipase family protein [Elizabethkingia]KUG10932.1 peptidoglycan-binding protein [Elizabethkingia miricola]MCL1656592.1 GDSL-type esterase/lipase family protein [Elizabethkingia miricola]OIK47517.1 peptidoglycan-binding protein [Elizabethkingia sp. HvH-WGS333]